MQQPLGAQVRDTVTRKRDSTLVLPVPPGADSLLLDSLAKRRLKEKKADSIKAPITNSEAPVAVGIAQRFRWTRDSLFTTGAITVGDLLARVPGVTTFNAGWISAPGTATYLGDFRQLRVFFDGYEMPVLDPRNGGILDLTQVNIWAAEEVILEQAPEEVRVYVRSWRVRSTTAETRTDVSTGDQQTNLYRGYYGRRYDGGGIIQFGAQQYGTTPPSVFGNSSDQLGIVGRVGWATSRYHGFSVDAFATHNGRHRGEIFGELQLDSIPTLESSRTDAYVRLGTGDPDTSVVWGQVMAVGSTYTYTGVRTLIVVAPKTHADSVRATLSLDTTVARSQYVASIGSVKGPFRVSFTQRFFGGPGHIAVPSVRASLGMTGLVVSARAEGKGIDSVARSDVTAQLMPFSFVSILGGIGRARGERVVDSTFTTNYVRGEAGLRIKGLWLLGGVLRRDSTQLSAPVEFDTNFVVHRAASATGVTAAVRGQLWRVIHTDLSAIRWNDSGFYRPRYQTRSEIFIRTNLRERFPSGNLGILFSAVHEYRSGVLFPVRSVVPLTPDRALFLAAPGYRTISTLLEIRILSATVSWQFRNLLGERYAQVPFFIMPRQTNFYGVRWDFFN